MKQISAFIKKYLYAALSCLYLFTIGFFSAKNRTLVSTICTHFGYGKKRAKAIIPQVELSELVPEDIPIQLREPMEVDGNISLLEVVAMAKLINLHNPGTLFEFGTFDGRTTLNMAANCSQEAKVYTLDLPKNKINSTKFPIDIDDRKYVKKQVSGSRYQRKNCEKKITQLYGDSAEFDFSPFLNRIDFVFIDGSHAYGYVLNDSKKALQLLKNRKGVILWHDYSGFEGVTQALNELYATTNEFKGLKHIKETSLACLIIS